MEPVSHDEPQAEARDAERRRTRARVAAALFLLASLIAAVQAHLDLRAATAERRLALAAEANGSADRAALLADVADDLEGWTATGDLRDLTARLKLAQSPDDADELALAETWTLAALNRSPARPEAWARLATLESRLYGEATEAARRAMRTSFVVSPYGSDALLRERLAFVIGHWNELEPRDHRAALRQVPFLARSADERDWLAQLAEDAASDDARRVLERELSFAAP